MLLTMAGSSSQRRDAAASTNTTNTSLPPSPSKFRRINSSKLRLFLIFLSFLLVALLTISQALFWTRREDLETAVESALDFANQELHYIENQVKQHVLPAVDTQSFTLANRNENRSMHEHGTLVKYAETTIVTAYFQLKSKYSDDTYDNWMGNMLGLQDAMVIFTSPNLVETMRMHRQHALNRTVIISMPLEHTPIAYDYNRHFWQAQLEMDPERKIHQDYPLFWIWLSKSWFVEESIHRNYFDSKLYMWCDIGSFRIKRFQSQRLVRYPKMVPRHSVLFMAHHTPNAPPDKIWNDKIRQKQHFYHSGSQAIAYRDTWLTFHQEFMHTVSIFVERNMFLGEDQAVLQSTCLLHPNLCAYISFNQVADNHYFGLRTVLNKGGTYTYWRPPGADVQQEQVSSK